MERKGECKVSIESLFTTILAVIFTFIATLITLENNNNFFYWLLDRKLWRDTCYLDEHRKNKEYKKHYEEYQSAKEFRKKVVEMCKNEPY